MIIVSELSPEEGAEWDDYVRRRPGGLPLHLSGWRQVLHKTYGYRTSFLFARIEGVVTGVLPLFLVRSRLFGNTATTLPGGLCADDSQSAAALLDQAIIVAKQWGAARLRIHDTRLEWPGEFRTASHHEHWSRDISMGADALWQDLDGNLRRQVRKARKNGLRVEIDRSGALLEPFYTAFSRFTHEAGTPVFSLAFLQNVIAEFPSDFNIAVAWHEGIPVAGYFQLEMGSTAYGMWGAALRDYQQLRPVHLALWELMSDSAERGFLCLDMGRSPTDSNASRFKGQWGGTQAPVMQQVHLLKGSRQADTVTTGIENDEKYQLFVRIWPKLPLPMTRYFGPRLRRHLPFA